MEEEVVKFEFVEDVLVCCVVVDVFDGGGFGCVC